VNQLELYDLAGCLIRNVAVSQDEQDATKWHLAEPVALGANQIESAVLRFGDGTSHAVEPSLFLDEREDQHALHRGARPTVAWRKSVDYARHGGVGSAGTLPVGGSRLPY